MSGGEGKMMVTEVIPVASVAMPAEVYVRAVELTTAAVLDMTVATAR